MKFPFAFVNYHCITYMLLFYIYFLLNLSGEKYCLVTMVTQAFSYSLLIFLINQKFF